MRPARHPVSRPHVGAQMARCYINGPDATNQPEGETVDLGQENQQTLNRARLFDTEEGLSLLADIAEFGVWELDLASNELRWDDRMFLIYGIDPAGFTGRYEDWVNALSTDSRERSESAFNALLESDARFDIEMEIRRANDGEVRVLRGLARLFRAPDGTPLRAFGINEDITERALAARRLELEEAKFRSLFEVSPIGFAMNDLESGEFLEFNEALCSPAGYTAEEFRALSYWDLTPARYAAAEQKALDSLRETGRYGPFEKEYIRKDGATYPVRLNGALARTAEGRDVIWSIIEDVSALKRAQSELAAQKERFQGIFELTDSGVAVYEVVDDGADFRFTEYNPAAERIDKLSREQVIGRTLRECFPNIEEMGLLDALREAWRTGNAVELPLIEYSDDRISVWRENRIFRLSSGEVVAVYSDVTGIKAAQLAAERANDARRQFLANMSHEIRTPLNAVVGITELLRRTSLTHEQQDYLNKIGTASRLLVGIINDILDLSKIDAGKLELETSPFDLSAAVEDLRSLFEPAAAEKGLELIFRLPDQPIPYIVGDELRLIQVLTNLLSNAIKFTTDGGVTLSIEQQACRDHQVELRFSVTDTGIGISAAQRAELFQPFQQADVSTTRIHGGTGLGLTISQNLVRAMGGEINLISVPGQGSEFSFTLLCPTEQAGVAVGPAVSAAVALPDFSRHTILLVEDNALNQMVTQKFIADTHANILLAGNGSEAVAMVAQHSIDLVLMDLQMPVMDGFVATQQIRAMRPDLPIIALSAAVLDEERARAAEVGMNGHLAKPIEPSKLISTLRRYLAEPALPSQLDQSVATRGSDALPQDVLGFDLQRCRDAYEDEDFLRELLQVFYQQLSTEYAVLQSVTPDTMSAEYLPLLHKFKGSAMAVGADRLATASAALESALKDGQRTEQQTRALRQAFTDARRALGAIFGE